MDKTRWETLRVLFWHPDVNVFLVLFIHLCLLVSLETCGQSYKASTIINYDSRVVIWGIFQSGMNLES